MTETPAYHQGHFCWVDLATTDPEAAKAFYGTLFGWDALDVPTDMGEPYTMLALDGREAAALYRLSPEQGSQPFWNCYVRVDDVDAMAARAESLGGSVLMPPMEVMEHGRMAVIQDPSGAPLSLWQPRAYPGAAIDNQVGARSWCELLTRDTVRAAAFFSELFGWTTRTEQKLMEGRYILFELDGKPVGGMLEIQPEWGPMPPNWVVYFGVADCDGTLTRAREQGGTVTVEPIEIADVGRFAYLGDPQGAQFAVIQFAHPVG